MSRSSETNSFWSGPGNVFADPNIPQPASFPTASKVKQEARERSRKIFADWTTLHKLLGRYEELLRKRWVKKTQEQRKKILLAVWPNMPSTHRPDFQALRRESTQQRCDGTKFRDAYLWPYINVEDLTKGKSLLLFLNARGRHLPDTFAHADFDAVQLGQTSLAIRSAFLNEHTMLLSGQTTPEAYGQLVAWDQNDEAFDCLMSGIGFHPGHGLQVLEIQQEILRFLVQCCHLILHDLPSSSLTDQSVPVQPEPLSISRDETEWPSLAFIAAEAPYRVPAHLDFRRLQAIVVAKRSAAEDHIWALREDPGYFGDNVGDWSEHRQETLLDINGKRHPVLNKPLFWDRVLGNVIVDAYGTFLTWDVIYQQVSNLTALKQKYSNVISSKKKLPSEYGKALQNFRYLLNRASKGPIGNLKTGVPASPPLRSLFVREPQVPNSTMIRVETKSAAGKDPLMWIFQALWDDHQLFLCGLQDLTDEFERLIQGDPKQKERISPWVAQVFSDLAVMAEIRRQLSLYHPSLSTVNEEDTEEIKADFATSLSGLAELVRGFDGVSLANVGTPSEGRFHYPSDKRRTQQSIRAMREAEQHLDLFWRTADQQFASKIGRSQHQAIQHLLSEDREVQRTPEWVEPIEGPSRGTGSETPEVPYRNFDQLRLDREERTQRTVLSENNLPAKTKIKSRGAVQPTEPVTATEQLEQHKPDIQPTFAVSKRAFKVFSILFHNPAQSDTPGQVAWSDFLHAMAATGFAPEKLYGSVWQFTPTKLDVERSIQFHEPHPRREIPFRTARRHGRRLNRAYGWSGNMFVVA
ncbi:MAG: hypothetical protein M1830_008799 [Pleopsidium flavum]|nr:MAG: hypothetical protein M1830_008799 [Pleopsidium flavum]